MHAASHNAEAASPASLRRPEPDGDEEPAHVELRFEDVYVAYADQVARWLRLFGAPLSERDDLVQEVFVIVHRRLAHFQGDDIGPYIYRVARRKYRDHRRLAWFQRVFRRTRGQEIDGPDRQPLPLAALETKQRCETLERLLEDLNENERAALLLFELDGVPGARIAELQKVPINTVWARIHSARLKLGKGLQGFEDGKGVKP